MNIALLGSGGREHALCEKLLESKFSSNIICIPGNAGTSKIATNVDIDFLNFKNTELAAATLICWPIILLQREKKTSFLVTSAPSL